MTGALEKHANKPGRGRNPSGGAVRWLVRLPLMWAALTVVLAGAAAFLHLKGHVASVQALYVSVFALFAFAGLAWALGAARARNSPHRG